MRIGHSLFLLAALSTVALPAQQASPASCIWVECVDAVTGAPVNEAYAVLLAAGASTPEVAITGLAGRAAFPALTPQPNNQGQEVLTLFTAEVAAVGFLPYKRVVEASANRRVISCRLVPVSAGFVTPLVRAEIGGVFELSDLGTLTVPPGVLTQNARIKLIPVPDSSCSVGLMPDILRYQVWVQAEDDLGQLLPGVIPSQHSGLTLGLTLPSLAPEDATSEVWTSHALGLDLSQDLQTPAPVSDDRLVSLSLCEGYNAATQTYAVPVTTGCGDLWRPWEYIKSIESVEKEVVGSVAFKCGHYMASKTFGQGKNVTHTTEVEMSVENCQEVGIERSTPVSKLSLGFSNKITATVGSSSATTTTFEQTTSVTATEPVSGVPGTQPAGWACVSGTVEFGYLRTTYRITARRIKVCIGAYFIQTMDLGTIEVCGLFDMWFTGVAWDPSCNCGATGSVPADMRVH
jgi:hypothetical protein